MLLEIIHSGDTPREWADIAAVRMTGPSTAQITIASDAQAWFLLRRPTRATSDCWIYYADDVIFNLAGHRLSGRITHLKEEIELRFVLHLK